MNSGAGKLRVLHMDSGRQMRGGQWQVSLLMEELALKGAEQTLLARAGSPLGEAAAAAGIAVAPWGLVSLRRHGPAVALIHAHDARSHTLAAICGSAPLVVSRRVAFPIGGSWFSGWKYRRPKMYLAVSEFVRRQLIAGGIAEELIMTAPDAVRPPSGGGCADSSPERNQIVAIRSDDPGKGGELIRRAAALAEVQIRFSGDLAADLPRAKLFVYVSAMEGLGSAALLAAAHGVPVVASAVGGLPEAVLDGETGILTQNDPEEIARAIRRLTGDPSLATRMGERGRLRAERDFSPAALAAVTWKAYERALS